MDKPKVYIAGPFFNKTQNEHLDQIIEMLELVGLPYYSPRDHSGSKGLKPNPADRGWNDVFKSNVDELQDCDVILANLHWALNPDTRLCLVQASEGGGISLVDIALPDSGTVWEMGWAYAHQKPIVAFTPKANAKLNLMLAKTYDALVVGFENLRGFLQVPLQQADQLELALYANPPEKLLGTPWAQLCFDWSYCEERERSEIE